MSNPRDFISNIKVNKVLELKEILINAGSLAPSTHNTQPWKVKKQSDGLIIKPNLNKVIPQADPLNRYLFMSLGAFVENVDYVLTKFNISHKISISKSGETSITFKNQEIKIDDKMIKSLRAISVRQNFRGFYNKASDSDIKSIMSAFNDLDYLKLTKDNKDIEVLASCTAKGVEGAYSNKEFRLEIANLINPNSSKKKYGLHGYSLRMSNLFSVIIPKIMKVKNIGKLLGKLNKKSFTTSTIVGLLHQDSSKNNPKGWVEIGIKMEKTFLELAEKNWFASIYVASLELDETRKTVSGVFGIDDDPQLLFTIGKTDELLKYSPRYNTEEIIKT